MSGRDVCAAHGCAAEPFGSSQFCLPHLQPKPAHCRRVWAAITRARVPDTRHALVTVRSLAADIGLHSSTVWRAMLALERLGYIRRPRAGVVIIEVSLEVSSDEPAADAL